MISSAISRIALNLPDLLSFMPSPVDQSPWERVASPSLTSSSPPAVEVDLFALLRNFLGHQATPSLMGQAFLDNNPNVLSDVWALDRGFTWLLTGLPRWLPLPSLTRAHLARARLLSVLTTWHTAYDRIVAGEDPGSEWRDLDADVSEWMRRRAAKFRELGLKPSERAPADLAVLWA